MQDVFIEYMVTRRKTGKHIALTLLIILGAILIALAAFFFSGLLGPFSMFGFLLAFGAMYGAYYLITSFNVEYEYMVTNGEMDIDQITNQRKRKRLISVNMRNVEEFGRYNPEQHASRDYKTRVIACDALDSEDLWYAVFRHKDKGQTLAVFNASDRMLDAIKPFLPRTVMHDAFVRQH